MDVDLGLPAKHLRAFLWAPIAAYSAAVLAWLLLSQDCEQPSGRVVACVPLGDNLLSLSQILTFATVAVFALIVAIEL